MKNYSSNLIMESLHIQPQLTDYVLGLLSYDEKKALEQHAALCDVCRQALERERLLVQTVRETLTAVPLPSSAQLQQLMPQPPQKAKSWWGKRWQTINPLVPVLKPMAILAMVIMLFWGSLGLGSGSYAAVAATMTATSTTAPTATITQNEAEARPTVRPEQILATPEATPIAQLAPNPYTTN